MKLKTLKDLIVVCDVCKKYPKNNCHHPCCRNNKRVRHEAIKYIKDMKGFIERNKGKIASEKDEDILLEGAIKIIKHFFNITDEDLK